MSDSHLAIVLGTRPEIIKFAPVIQRCDEAGIAFSVVHTGQHYSDLLDSIFFEQLSLPPADHRLEIGSDSHGRQTAGMIERIESVLLTERPDCVLVQGDTNSALAGGIAASKLDVTLGHVEAGLRSFDGAMPEEINRVLLDHASDRLFAPTAVSTELLHAEGVPDDRIVRTGNTIVDALHMYRETARTRSTILSDLDVAAGEFALLTAHRSANVDDPDRFAKILSGVARFAERAEYPVIYPIHPRAEATIEDAGVTVPDPIRHIDPCEFFDFVALESAASIVFTDSGGVQEEACVLDVPCVTVREHTERPETVEAGMNTVVGVEPSAIVAGGMAMADRTLAGANPFGDGHAAERILDSLGLAPSVES